MSARHPSSEQGDIRSRLRSLVHHLEHVLPAQAPIKDFVHHNTLHGFQHLHFSEALRQARQLTGAAGYLPEARFRELYAQGRIRRQDLEAALSERLGGELEEPLLEVSGRPLLKGEAYLAVLLHPHVPISRSELRWQLEEMGGLTCFQSDVESPARDRILSASGEGGAATALSDLWSACLQALGLRHALLHPEELLDPSPETAEALLARIAQEIGPITEGEPKGGLAARVMGRESARLLERLLDEVGAAWTLRRLLMALTGEDLLEDLRPTLIRHIAAHLDQGLAAWHNPRRGEGFYTAWRDSARRDPSWMLTDLKEWRAYLGRLPDDPLEAIAQELRLVGLPEARWPGYLERLALEVPGWSGMVLWRSGHPGYAGNPTPVAMTDYLAVCLILERLFAQRLCRHHWGIKASLPGVRSHFREQPAELLVRHALFEGRLPEYLADFAERRVREADQRGGGASAGSWQEVAHLIWIWRKNPAAEGKAGHSVSRTAWPLFRLAQHLGLSGHDLRGVGRAGAEALLACLARFDADEAGYIWLDAYERRFREQIFAALAANHGRGPWAARDQIPEAQLVFCMDDREEGFRRHLEEINPRLETLGAAAHFGVFQHWLGLDDNEVTPLCPVVARPAHEVRELARPGAESLLEEHRRRRTLRLHWQERLHQRTRRDPLSALLFSAVGAPFAALALAVKALVPARLGELALSWRAAFDRPVPTRLELTAPNDSAPSTPDKPRLGFTDVEQADRVGAFLRNMGLTQGFAPLVVILGHGSNSLNNPHLAAYDCGACSGRHSGPNARLFAAMVNRPAVRALLAERGIPIPKTTWFVGAEHNTCDDLVSWYDEADVPAERGDDLRHLKEDLQQAAAAHAQERCRRFASAPAGLGQSQAWRHVVHRRWDFSEPRPELGHATNAWALIGRRSVTRGAFFDRRAFLISYDPTRDPEGTLLEELLLANGPVGAGINLEYYFSTVDNERYGCGTKTVHNLAGFFGVMEGTSSDLRTGLPRQMIEIHEAMRLLVVVEQKIDLITAVYQRQPPLQELIGNGWLLVAAKDPDSPQIHFFDPTRGWIPWEGNAAEVPSLDRSADWFLGQREPLPPALLTAAVKAA